MRLAALLAVLHAALSVRAFGFAPSKGPCPPDLRTSLLRPGPEGPASQLSVTAPGLRKAESRNKGKQTLSKAKRDFIANRRRLVRPALAGWLGDDDNSVLSTSTLDFDDKLLPNIALSMSGGGVRGALFAASFIAALDGRNASSRIAHSSSLAGLLQSSTYIASLSGSA